MLLPTGNKHGGPGCRSTGKTPFSPNPGEAEYVGVPTGTLSQGSLVQRKITRHFTFSEQENFLLCFLKLLVFGNYSLSVITASHKDIVLKDYLIL